ncbi:MAG: diguanylate cyclase [Actinomycetota bacterium]|nr:diguanylate cyclase [Actinomycetota bacterium]
MMNKRKKKSDLSPGVKKEISFLKALMDNIPDSIYFKDRAGRFVKINKATAEKIGLNNPDDAAGKTDFDFFGKDMAEIAYGDEQNIIKTGKPIVDVEYRETYMDREDRWIAITKTPWRDKNGNIIGILGIARDITDRKKAEDKIEYLSFHDTLTGLYNRAYFEEELRRLDTERQLPLSMVMGDVNGLKVINDAYGHEKGDILLKKIANILKGTFRKEDIISRWGGDEFIVILPRTAMKDVSSIIKRIKALCKKNSTTKLPLSISLGVSTKKSPEKRISDVIKEAESKMYKIKISDSKSVHESLVESLKESLKKDSRSSDTGDKKEEFAVLLGKKLNLSPVKLEELKLLLNLHNIGKLALVDEIMSKKGRLTREEWEIVKEIPEIGYRIAKSSPKLRTIAEAILSHHEWYNGSGYPKGIKGEKIPVLSRISFIINAYDAMRSDRPYCKKMTEAQAIKEIKKYSGTQFDPKIAKVFIEILKNKKN